MPDLEDSHRVPKSLKDHYLKGEYGVKTKQGFYDYHDGKDEQATKQRDEKLQKVYQALYKK